ncbi:MAG: hypothetical protein EPO20_05545, partial [Betaproteobacteria bacterium]
MSDLVLGIRLSADGKQLVGAVEQSAGAIDKMGDATKRATSEAEKLNAQQKNLAQSYSAITQAQVNANYQAQKAAEQYRFQGEAMGVASAQVQKLLDRYDPLGTKLRSLQADFAALNKAASAGEIAASSDSAVDKTYKALNEEIGKTKGLMAAAGAATEGSAASMDSLGLNSQRARQQLMMLGREALTGDFSQMPRTFGSLVAHSNLLPTLLNPVVLGIVALGVASAGIGVAVAHAESFNRALNRMQTELEATGRGSMISREELKSLIEQMALMPGMSKSAAEQTLSAFAQTHAIGSGLFKDLARVTNDFAAATGETAPAAAKKLAAAFADPTNGARMLDKELGTLTASQILNIEQMQKQNDLAGAQKALYAALAPAIEGLARNGLTPLQKATNDVGVAWDRLTKSMGDSGALKAANSAIVGIVDSFAWVIGHADEIAAALLKIAPLPVQMLAGLARAAGTASTAGSRSASGTITTGQQAGSADADEVALNKQMKGALALGEAYSTLAAKASALEVTQRAIKAALDESTASGDTSSAAFLKLSNQYSGVTKAVADAWRAAGAEGRALATGAIADATKLYEVRLKSAADEADAQLKIGAITKKQHDDLIKGIDLAKIARDKSDAAQKLALGGLDKLQRQSLTDQIALYDAMAAARQDKAVNADRVEAYRLTVLQADADARASAESVSGQLKSIEALEKANDAIRTHNAEIGKTREQIDQVKANELDRAIRLAEYDRTMNEANEAYIARLDTQIAKLREQQGLLRQGAALEANAAASKAFAQQAKRDNEEIGRGLTDALMRGFESGKGFAVSFRDSLVNMFKTMILRPVISFIVSPISGAITAAMSGMSLSGAANAASGGANLLSAGSMFAGLPSIGTALGNFGTAFSTFTTMVGEGASAMSAFSAAAAGMGPSLMAIAPWIAGAVAIGGALGLFGGDDRTATPQMAGLGSTSTINRSGFSGQQWVASGSSPTDLWAGSAWSDLASDQLAGFNKAITKVFSDAEAAAKQLGIDTSSLASLTVSMGATGNGVQADMQAALQKTADTVALSLMPNLADLQQGGETLAQTFGRLVAIQDQQNQLAFSMMDQQQQLAFQTKQLSDGFAALGIAVPASKDAFRELVQGLDITTLSGQNTLARLIQLGPTFTAVADAATGAVADVGRSLQDIANERRGLQDQLDQLTMTSAQLLEKQRGALDASNQALFNQVQAAQAAKDATAAAAQAESDAAAKQAAIATERQGLQDQLDQLTLTSAQLLEKQRGALDASNQALFDQVQAASAAAQAVKDASAAMQAQAAAAAAIASQRYGLETQLLQAQGDTAELRARELA